MVNITLFDLYKILESVGIPVGHYEAHLDNLPYISYQEMDGSYAVASGKVWRETTKVIIDHLTKDEWDESLERLKKALLKNKIIFTFTTNWYEDLKIIHTQINLAIARDMEV